MRIPLRNSADRYGVVSMTLHWLMAVMIIGLLALGLYMADLPSSPDKFRLYGLHKAFGATVLFLAVLRVLWMTGSVRPTDSGMPPIQAKLALAAHFALYFFMFAMPLSGWVMSSAAGFPVSVFGLFMLPDLVAPDKGVKAVMGEFHEISAFILMAILAAHIGAALLHHFFNRDNILKRMLPFKMLFALALLPSISHAGGTEWKISGAESRLTFIATQNNSPVKGWFGEFSGQITFDKDKPNDGKIHINVKMDSVQSDSPEIADNLKSDIWLGVKNYPDAVFDSSNIKVDSDGYVAQGNLMIRGVTLPASLKFSFEEYSATKAVAKGEAMISRIGFGVGQGEWVDTKTIKDEVKVEFSITATSAS